MWQTIGHDWAIDLFRRTLQQERLAHAYLFVGLEQIGKRTLANEFAAALNCTGQEPPCGLCPSCRKMLNATHPDVLYVAPQNGKIKIEQIRELQRQVALSPYEGKLKVCIITNLQLATVEAENALLKTLEEPPSRVVLLLTATNPELLLPTVISRCQTLQLRPVSSALIERRLCQQEGQTEQQAALITRWAAGRIGWALNVTRDKSLLTAYQKQVGDLVTLLGQNQIERMRTVEGLAKRENLREVLRLWQVWWRDVVLVASDNDTLAINGDQLPNLRLQASDIGAGKAISAFRATGDALAMLDQNVNPRLVLEGLVLNWARVPANRTN